LDGNIVNLTIPLTSVQCGIYETYKNKTIVDVIPLYKDTGDVVAFINDTVNDDLIITNISTHSTFEPDFDTIQIPLSALSKLSPIALALLQLPQVTYTENPVIPSEPIVENGIIKFSREYIRRFLSGDYMKIFDNIL